MEKEKIDLSISEDKPSEFWLDNTAGFITVRFKVNDLKHGIL